MRAILVASDTKGGEMAKLTFDTAAVKELFDHAMASKEHRLGFGQLCDPKLLRTGEKMPARGYADESQIDKSRLEPSLILVKDSGCYLMSSGLPSLPGSKTANKVVYAKGLGPDCDYDVLRSKCGGDDFAEHLPARMFEQAVLSGAKSVTVSMTQKFIKVEFREPTRTQAKGPDQGPQR